MTDDNCTQAPAGSQEAGSGRFLAGKYVGQKFGKLTVLSVHREGDVTWAVCQCECGGNKTTRMHSLIKEIVRSCGCLRRAKDLSGTVFGRLTVVSRSGTSGDGRPLWLCRCECGNHVVSSRSNIKSGHTSSCGCLKQQMLLTRSVTHGQSGDRIYTIWLGMLARCNNPKAISYKNYGARGISVCREWNDAAAFLSWAEGSGYAPSLSLDRVDNNQGYNPENCRWATPKEQASNTRRSVLLTAGGETLTQDAWAARLGVSHSAIVYRLKGGWTVEDAVLTPPGKRRISAA